MIEPRDNAQPQPAVEPPVDLRLDGDAAAPAGAPPAARIRRNVRIPLHHGTAEPIAADVMTFGGLLDGQEHLALRLGPRHPDVPLVRVHSECLTGEVLGSRAATAGTQLARRCA